MASVPEFLTLQYCLYLDIQCPPIADMRVEDAQAFARRNLKVRKLGKLLGMTPPEDVVPDQPAFNKMQLASLKSVYTK